MCMFLVHLQHIEKLTYINCKRVLHWQAVRRSVQRNVDKWMYEWLHTQNNLQHERGYTREPAYNYKCKMKYMQRMTSSTDAHWAYYAQAAAGVAKVCAEHMIRTRAHRLFCMERDNMTGALSKTLGLRLNTCTKYKTLLVRIYQYICIYISMTRKTTCYAYTLTLQAHTERTHLRKLLYGYVLPHAIVYVYIHRLHIYLPFEGNGKPSSVHATCGVGLPAAEHFSETAGPGCSVCSIKLYSSTGGASGCIRMFCVCVWVEIQKDKLMRWIRCDGIWDCWMDGACGASFGLIDMWSGGWSIVVDTANARGVSNCNYENLFSPWWAHIGYVLLCMDMCSFLWQLVYLIRVGNYGNRPTMTPQPFRCQQRQQRLQNDCCYNYYTPPLERIRTGFLCNLYVLFI